MNRYEINPRIDVLSSSALQSLLIEAIPGPIAQPVYPIQESDAAVPGLFGGYRSGDAWAMLAFQSQEEPALQSIPTTLKDVVILEPKVFGDERGFFLEAYNEETFRSLGLPTHFMQDNHSGSRKGVLRGLHYQLTRPQGKLVRALRGQLFDVAVDLRRDSAQYGQWFGVELSAENRRMLWIPPGFAHGFLVQSEFAEVAYKATELYSPESERSILWNDPAIGIRWPLDGEPSLSDKDRAGQLLSDADIYGSSDL